MDGSAGVEYDVRVSSGVQAVFRAGITWGDDGMLVVVRPSSATSSELSFYAAGRYGNQTCELDGATERRRFFDCDGPGENRAASFYEGFQEILSANASAMEEVGARVVAGRQCTLFRADAGDLVLNETEYSGRSGRLTVCLDAGSGRPLQVVLEEKEEAFGDRPRDWESLAVLNASSYDASVAPGDVDPLMPFTVSLGYAEPNASVFHAVVEATTGFDGRLRAGSLGDGSVGVDLGGGERRVVELPVTNASRASRFDSDESWSDPELSSENIPVCLDGRCVYADDSEDCLLVGADECEGLAACRLREGVCVSRPVSCMWFDEGYCDGSVTWHGRRCGWTPKGCVPRGEAEGDADYVFSPSPPVVGEPVRFTVGRGAVSGASYDWFVGEDRVGSGASLTYTFQRPLPYLVGLRVNGSSWSARRVTPVDE